MKRVRAAVALALVGAAATYGVAAAPAAAAAVQPLGGCWTYVPASAELDAPPASDISTVLEPWVTELDGGVTLETSGATVKGGQRTVTLRIDGGPVLSADRAVAGTASFFISVDGKAVDRPMTADFALDADAPVDELQATVQLPIEAAGSHQVRLDRAYFDVPAAADAPGAELRVACNGQLVGVPGQNPATQPEPTIVAATYATVATTAVEVTKVDDQAVTTAARAGDTVTIAAEGFASDAKAEVSLCADGTCTEVGSLSTGADGSGTATFTVPGTVPAGPMTLTVEDPDPAPAPAAAVPAAAPTAARATATAPLTVLGTQIVAAAEELTPDTTVITLNGTGWDPRRDVTIRGYAGPSSSAKQTADAEVVAEVDDAGEFTAEFEVADEATVSVIAEQSRTGAKIGSVYLISGVIGGGPGGPGDPNGPQDPQDPSDPPAETPPGDAPPVAGTPLTPPVGGAAPVDPPADIPLPGDVPVEEPPGEQPASEEPGELDLSVTEVRLDGEMTFSELFGGSPERDLVFLVENLGSATVENPIIRVSVGRSEDLQPEIVAAEVGTLDPGEQAVVTVPLALPMAAFGTYHVVGQVGDTENGAFDLTWESYPWGLFGLNALALALLVVGVRHRLAQRRPSPAAAAAAPGLVGAEGGDAIVDLTAADAWWAYRAGGGPKPRVRPELPPLVLPPAAPARTAAAVEEPAAGEAIVDLDAAERWWSKSRADRSARAS